MSTSSASKLGSAVNGFATGLGIVSFFLDFYRDAEQRRVDEEMFARLDAIKADLGDLNDLSNAIINQNIATSLGLTDTALDRLRDYAEETNSELRADYGRQAIADAGLALNEVRNQVDAVKGTASLDSLVYAFGAVHYAMIVRQAVAVVVEDGPIGGSGLHQRIKEASALLYNEQDRESDLLWQMEARIFEAVEDHSFTERDLDVIEFYGKPRFFFNEEFGRVDANYGQNVLVRSGLTDNFSSRSVYRSDFGTSLELGLAAIPLIQPRIQAVIAADMEELGINLLRDIGETANEFLGENALDILNEHEIILGDGSDTEVGTDLADYISGNGGDDILTGDGTLNGGPDAISGGTGNDILRGGALNDVLRGGDGNDVILGGNTFGDPLEGDIARFSGRSSEYTVEGGTTYAIVLGPNGQRDKLANIEFLRFDDGIFALDAGSALDGKGELEEFITAENIALLYEAALDRDNDPQGIDAPGLNFWTDYAEELLTEQGLGLREMSEVIAEFLMESPEFTTKFGNVDTMNNAEFLGRVYQNILGRAPDTGSGSQIGGLEFYLGLLDGGEISKAAALADIAISPENAEQSAEVLMGLYQASTPEQDLNTGILLEWSFVA